MFFVNSEADSERQRENGANQSIRRIWIVSIFGFIFQDPIPSHLLQAISPTLLPALTHIINTSLLTGIFSTAFKQALVTPLLKKTYIKHFSYRKLQTCLSPSIHSENTWTSSTQPGLIVFFTEQQTGR